MKKRRIYLSVPIILILLVFGGFSIWAYTPLGPMPETNAALISDGQVRVEPQGDWWVFSPDSGEVSTGFILYPGGRVDWRSYAPLAKAIAQNGLFVALVPMPFNLAVFSPQKGLDVIRSNPQIRFWAIGGHSLGGAMAANFVYQNPGLVQGLVLWASYPADNNPLSNVPVKAISIYGSEDGLATVDVVKASQSLLPADTRWVEIAGGNHAQFGWYGNQPGDGEALINREDQQLIVVAETVRFLKQISFNGVEQ
ncbi:MAG: alpha/beta hydrolase [Chloroflexota bacterium]